MNNKISVIMSVYNETEEYLRVAIQSILMQSHTDFEFIIIDDGSNDSVKAILSEYSSQDSRIQIITNYNQIGLTKSLNKGLKVASGSYIARMDSDDFSVRERFEKQVAFFREHPEVDIVGTGVMSFGSKNIFMSPWGGMDDDNVRAELFFTSTLCHPSVMIRKSFLDKYSLTYDESVNKGQDYDMWERCSVFGKVAVMREVLLYYRIHDKQITSQFKSAQVMTAEMVMKRRLARIKLSPSEEEFEAHLVLKGLPNAKYTTLVDSWGDKLIKANEEIRLVTPRVFENNIRRRIALAHLKNKKIKMKDILFISDYLLQRFRMKKSLNKEIELFAIEFEKREGIR